MTFTPPTSVPSLAPGLRRDLVRVLGSDAVLTDPDRLLVYEADGLTHYRQAPAAVLLPRDTASCSRAVGLLHAEGIAVVPRGAGTGLSGGAVPAPGTVVLGTARMNRILWLDPATRRARVQAGVVNADLTAAAAPYGLAYAPDPSSQSACTLGGNVAENSGGPHCLKYGVTSRYVAALTVVGPGGEVLELDRDPTGETLDLVGLFVGSEGCFGLATEMELALITAPEAARTLLAVFPRPDEAGEAVTAILAEGLLPAAMEIVDGATIRAVEASVYAAGYPVGAGAALVVEFDGPDAGLDSDLARAAELSRAAGAAEVRTAATAWERLALWQGRKKAFGAMGRLAPDLLVQDATVPRSSLPRVLREVNEIAHRWGLQVANVFHAGDGNLHPNLLFDRRDPGQVARVEAASGEIMKACVAAGGTITGEHGVGLDKRAYMHLVCGPAELAAMEGVRRVFDPAGRFNPGKVLPDGSGIGAHGPAPTGSRPGGAMQAPGPDAVLAAMSDEGVEAVPGPGGRPLVRPSDTAAVARVLARAGREGWTVRVTGGGDSRGAASGRDADLVLTTEALHAVEGHEPADLTVAVAAGTPVSSLQAHLLDARQWLAVDGPGVGGRSVGGLVAGANAPVLSSAFGGIRDQVLGLTVVTGEGRILELGGAVVKNVAGFDLVRLMVGSRGRLGVVTRVILRTQPVPRAQCFLRVARSTPGALLPAVDAVLRSRAQPASLECGVRDGEAVLLVRLVGSPAQVAHAASTLTDRVGAGGVRLETAAGLEEQERLRGPAPAIGPPLRGAPSVRGLEALLARAGEAGAGRIWALPDQGLLWCDATVGPETERSESVRTLEEGLWRVFDPMGTLAAPVASGVVR